MPAQRCRVQQQVGRRAIAHGIDRVLLPVEQGQGLLVIAQARAQPRDQTDQLGACLWLGLLQERFLSGHSSLLGDANLWAQAGGNPWLQVCVPLGVWLNGVTLARRADRTGARLFWAGAAVTALFYLLTVLPYAWLNGYAQHVAPSARRPVPLQAAYLLLAFAGEVASWWVVLRQLARAPEGDDPLWALWWRAPAAGALVGMGYFVLHLAMVLGPRAETVLRLSGAALFGAALLGAAVKWGAGVIAFQLPQATRTVGRDVGSPDSTRHGRSNA